MGTQDKSSFTTNAALFVAALVFGFLAGLLVSGRVSLSAFLLIGFCLAIAAAGMMLGIKRRSGNKPPEPHWAEPGMVDRGQSVPEQSHALVSSDAELLTLLGKYEGLYERNLLTDEMYHSSGILHLLGYTEDDPIWTGGSREELSQLVHPDDREATKLEVDAYIAGAHQSSPGGQGQLGLLVQEFRMLDGQGKYRWVRTRNSVRLDESGQPATLFGTVNDIHDFKQMALEQRGFLRAVVELFGVWDLQTDLLVQVSSQWEAVLGYSEEELLGITIEELVHPDDAGFLRRIGSELRQAHGCNTYRQATINLRLLNGSYQSFSSRFMCSDTSDDRVLMVLFDSESVGLQTLASVSNTLPHGFYLFDVLTQEVIFYNRQLPTLLGYTPEEFDADRNRLRLQVVHPDDVDKLTAQLREIVVNNTDETYSIHYRVKTKQGHWRTLLRHGVVYLRDRKNKPIQISLTVADITELENVKRVAAQAEELERLNNRLATSNADLERFGYVASHDLQEPLRAISGYLQLLDEKLGDQLDESSKRYLDKSVEGAARMRQLINDLLSFSRLQRRGFAFTRVKLSQVLSRTSENLATLINDEKAEISSDTLPTIGGNEALLTDLFTNLITNGIKYRHPERRPRIQITSRERGDYVVLEFKDNGIGIAEQHQKQVFELFARLHRREDYPGTGIGLAVCKRIVELHNGKISLRSESGKGSVFEVHLHSRLQKPVDEKEVSAAVSVE